MAIALQLMVKLWGLLEDAIESIASLCHDHWAKISGDDGHINSKTLKERRHNISSMGGFGFIICKVRRIKLYKSKINENKILMIKVRIDHLLDD